MILIQWSLSCLCTCTVGDDKKTDAGPGAHFEPQFVRQFINNILLQRHLLNMLQLTITIFIPVSH